MSFKFQKRALCYFIVVLCMVSCEKDTGMMGGGGNEINIKPVSARLESPLNESFVVPVDGKVKLEWESPATDADGDALVFTLFFDEVDATSTPQESWTGLTNKEIEVSVALDKKYFWRIETSDGTDTVTSSTFHFTTVETEPNETPPIPTLLSPQDESTLVPTSGKVTLEWDSPAVDADDDPLSFTVYMDEVDANQGPLANGTDITAKTLEVDVDVNKQYFWRVETTDTKETVTSATFSFSTMQETMVEGTVVSTAQELLQAISNAAAGDDIFIRGGVYTFNQTIEIDNDGSAGNLIKLFPHPDNTDRAMLDFSAMSESSSNRAIRLRADYWHIKGVDVFGAGDNGMNITGNDNIIEFCTFSECHDSGLQLGSGARNNTILNCDSYNNADSSIENADGFAAKLNVGDNNKFIGCRAWQNLDDGYDGYLRGANNISTIYENCWAFRNGITKDGNVGGGDGNGFKTGGSDDKDLKHNAVFTNCLAVGNVFDGFDHNSNRGEVTLYNCSAYDNGRNYSFSSTNPLSELIVKNCNVLGDIGRLEADEVVESSNSWQNGIVVTSDDFMSIDYTELIAARKPDGSLPDISFFHLTSSSDMIDQGEDVGLSFSGSAPDIGAFEFE